jgi:hypothetical protein
MSRTTKKIQSRCVQTRLTNEGELIEYRLMYPITKEFKWHLQTQEPDEHDFTQTINTKKGRLCNYYVRSSRNFSEIRKHMYLIMIKTADFQIKQLQSKKTNLVDTFSNF